MIVFMERLFDLWLIVKLFLYFITINFLLLSFNSYNGGLKIYFLIMQDYIESPNGQLVTRSNKEISIENQAQLTTALPIPASPFKIIPSKPALSTIIEQRTRNERTACMPESKHPNNLKTQLNTRKTRLKEGKPEMADIKAKA